MECYFDNAATSRVYDAVADEMAHAMKHTYGNPSSLHSKGLDAEHMVEQSREVIADTLKVDKKEILFTSGGTESNNTALFGAAEARKRKGDHIIVSSIEHPSVLNPAKRLEEQGFGVSYLPVTKEGVVDPDTLKEELIKYPQTILVSVMMVNNEVGSLQPVKKLSEVIKVTGSEALFHVDGVQAYGKIAIRPRQLGIDLMSASGHKFHGPKGVGFLYVRDGVRIKPYMYGGGQQKNMRSGTEDVFGIYGMSIAAKMSVDKIDNNLEKIKMLTTKLENAIRSMDKTYIHTYDYSQFPYILSTSIEGVRSEVLLHALDERGICVSSGSACATNDKHTSGTLKAMGLKEDLIDSAIRFSFSDENDEAQIDYAIEVLKELLPRLRMFTRR